MAEPYDLLTAIRATLAVYDDDALSALANKGLLRRAAKDLDSATLQLLDEEGGVRIDTGDAVVSLALPITTSRCSCPASGVCRHILLALLWLQRAAPTQAAPAACLAPGEEIYALTEDALQQWAGKPLLRRALQRLARGAQVTWEEGATLDFTFPALELSCRWLPGQGLAGMLCACHAPHCCEHRAMAILAFQAAGGQRELTLEMDAREAHGRPEVLTAVGAALNGLVRHGLSHLSPSSYQHIMTLAISAHGADLPRLERLLKTLASEITLQLSRDAQADTGNLLTAAARCEALRLALRTPTPALLGRHRSEYAAVKQLELLGMGAACWRTKSHFVGLTVYFWATQSREWMSWSDARPANSPDGFTPRQRLHLPGPWAGCASPAAICRQRISLRQTKRNAAGRISAHAEAPAEIHDGGLAGGPEPITCWETIAERAITLFSAGFQDSDERDALLYVEPAQWGTPSFQEIRQELVLPLLDARGSRLPLIVPYTAETADTIALLEQFPWARGTRLLGSLRFREGGVYLEPLVLYHGEFTINLTLDHPAKESSLLKKFLAFFSRPKDATPEVEPWTTVGALLDAALSELEIIAEGGASACYDTTRLEELVDRCAAVGLSHAAAKLSLLVEALALQRQTLTSAPTLVAQLLLHSYVMLRQMRVMDSLLQATAGLR